jgi:hypothetical protein
MWANPMQVRTLREYRAIALLADSGFLLALASGSVVYTRHVLCQAQHYYVCDTAACGDNSWQRTTPAGGNFLRTTRLGHWTRPLIPGGSFVSFFSTSSPDGFGRRFILKTERRLQPVTICRVILPSDLCADPGNAQVLDPATRMRPGRGKMISSGAEAQRECKGANRREPMGNCQGNPSALMEAT